ncbi:acetyl-CoA carboxylase biotin carboxyl carrier protein subunit [Sinomicrobium kalidii]|uniref:acetyl-CoA carboxylase biotin carboxyl carrier protein subunit n=1 Tax=Sinomicrobium kalidii TaxID=2900738 RepID=UPI001E5C003F|nr:acetyl-CoA carboxylase biotin carboxyl carrier protein subunit [Sinomicrobium kalidii]UGU17042.1 acetyl-CoA carboxylase biotin carboxyl carrier protein subunit [Sinomicrobium kalidii]
MDKTYKTKVNDTFDFTIDTRDITALNVAGNGKDAFHLLKDHRSRKAEITAADFLNKTYTIRMDGETYRVQISDDLDQLIEDMGFTRKAAEHILEIKAPMPGLVLDVQAEPGQTVSENDTLIVLEAMKMENVILSPRNGTIKSVTVKKGDAVDKKQLLLIFEE